MTRLFLNFAYLADLVYVPRNSKSKDPPKILPDTRSRFNETNDGAGEFSKCRGFLL